MKNNDDFDSLIRLLKRISFEEMSEKYRKAYDPRDYGRNKSVKSWTKGLEDVWTNTGWTEEEYLDYFFKNTQNPFSE